MNAAASVDEGIWFISEIPAAKRRPRFRWRAAGWLVAVGIAALAAVGIYAQVVDAVSVSRRARCSAQLRHIGLAMCMYQEAHGQFPGPAILHRDGTPLLSWRVAILPQLGYRSLYERFHLDEPWDSPSNRALIAEMPPEFGCPAGQERQTGRTGYLVIVGPENDGLSVNTAFAPTRGAALHHFTDGTSNTILVLETNAFVPWTKPDDFHWAKGNPLPRLASPHGGGAHAVFADGAARFLTTAINPEILKALFTMNGGEVTSAG
jgi:prepilin-type processing-associated H-X9-DG protein